MELSKKEVLDAVSRGVEQMLDRWSDDIWNMIEASVFLAFEEIATDNGDVGEKFFNAIRDGASGMEFTQCSKHSSEDGEEE